MEKKTGLKIREGHSLGHTPQQIADRLGLNVTEVEDYLLANGHVSVYELGRTTDSKAPEGLTSANERAAENKAAKKKCHHLKPEEKELMIKYAAANPHLTQEQIGRALRTAGVRIKGMKTNPENVTVQTEKEPAPAPTVTSSTRENSLHSHNTTDERKCQETIKKVLESMLLAYEGMTEAEQRAFDMGERYGLLETVAEGGDRH